jgi:sec-independent protein translocase protein TatA
MIVILALALLIFGPKKLPELGAGVGKAIREFKNGLREMGSASWDEPRERADRKETPADHSSANKSESDADTRSPETTETASKAR